MVGAKRAIPNMGRIIVMSGLALVVIFTALAFISDPLYTPVNSKPPMQSPLSHERGESQTGQDPACSPKPKNILCIFTGRWRYLRINFPYIYRSLRKNGGVLDKVYYFMIQYDKQTLTKLTQLTDSANKYLGEEVFELKIINRENDTTVRPTDMYAEVTYTIFGEIIRYPERKYFKMDDDIVYIHPGTFRQLIEQQNTSECFLHFANIGGANWRSSYIHQEMGVFDNKAINPKKRKFKFDPHAKCGWKSVECAALALRGFLYHYQKKSLDRFLFDGRYLTKERARYSINLLLLDKNIIDFKAITESGPIKHDDEGWLTEIYSRKVKNPNCVVGKAFVVHFSYYTTLKAILKKGQFLERFESIAYNDLVKYLPQEFQSIIAFNATKF